MTVQPPRLVTAVDADVDRVSAAEAIEIMRRAVVAHRRGQLQAPVRFGVELGSGQFVFTAGRLAGEGSGFRFGFSADPPTGELTLVLGPTGLPTGVVLGRQIGRRRTGALGGLAVDLCARPDASTLALIGAGEQAFTQLWAIAAVRDLKRIRVYSRRPDLRARSQPALRLSWGWSSRSSPRLRPPLRIATSWFSRRRRCWCRTPRRNWPRWRGRRARGREAGPQSHWGRWPPASAPVGSAPLT